MSFIKKELPHSRQKYFIFFAEGEDTATQTLVEDFAPSYACEIERIYIQLSNDHVSIIDFMAYLSHHLGTIHNKFIASTAMIGVSQISLLYEPTIKMFVGDAILFSMIRSAGNAFSLQISGWAITEAPRA